MESTNTNTLPTMSIHDFADDAADNLQIVCDNEKAPLTSGYILLTYTNKGDDTQVHLNGKALHITDCICNAIQNTEHGWQLFMSVMDEMERRCNARIKHANQ